jgi:hypothetical protein
MDIAVPWEIPMNLHDIYPENYGDILKEALPDYAGKSRKSKKPVVKTSAITVEATDEIDPVMETSIVYPEAVYTELPATIYNEPEIIESNELTLIPTESLPLSFEPEAKLFAKFCLDTLNRLADCKSKDSGVNALCVSGWRLICKVAVTCLP